MCMLNEAEIKVGLQGGYPHYHPLASRWDFLVPGPHSVMSNIWFFGRAIFSAVNCVL